jgi:dipeptidyl aminopeptidase/acylaminoacyl peptidase
MRHNSVKKESGCIQSSEGLPICYDLYLPTHTMGSLPVVLFLHGFKGFKDWGPFPDACYEVARAGCAVIAFNFSLNGVEGHGQEFTRLDLFERQTFSQDLEDIRSVIEGVQQQKIKTNTALLDSDTIAIIGHSRGGHTAIAAAAELPEVTTIVTWSAVADYGKYYTEAMKKDWEKKGYTEIKNTRTGQTMKIGKVVYDDLMANADRLIASKRVQSLMIPCCFIHGTHDKSVPMNHSQMLFQLCRSPEKERILINNADHTYNSSHPWEGEFLSDQFEEVVEKTMEWLETYFLGHSN